MSDDDVIHGALPVPTHIDLTNRTQRDAEATRLRALGWHPDDIARHLNLTPAGITAAIRRHLATLYHLGSSEQRYLQLLSYDELEAAAWHELRKHHVLVQHGKIIRHHNGQPVEDAELKLKIMATILRIKDARNKMLGLNAPTQLEVLTLDTIDAQIARLEAEIDAARELEPAEEDQYDGG